MLKKVQAQSLNEYVILLGIIVMFSVAMFPMVKRGTQSIMKAGADQIGTQANSEQEFTPEKGYLVSMRVTTNSDQLTEKSEWAGVMQTAVNEQVDMVTSTYTNLGFREDE